MRDLNRLAQTYMREHSGTLCGTQTCDAYFIHGLGHPIGMDVHDVTVPGRLKLEPGMVITLEPGIYLAEKGLGVRIDRKSTRLNSSHRCISYAVFCLKKKHNDYELADHVTHHAQERSCSVCDT